MELPLGKEESLTLEFKEAKALRDPANVAREVVGFLNSGEGGSIWIGVGETNGVADSAKAILDVEKEKDRLQNAIVDLVEPSPIIGRELDIEVQPGNLLLVRVTAGQRGPYALLRQGMRGYLVRTGSRLRALTREELVEALTRDSGKENSEDTAVKGLSADLAKWADEGFAGLKIVVRPLGKAELRLEKKEIEDLFRNPLLTGNRPLGNNFTSEHPDDRLKSFQDVYQFKGPFQWTSISLKGQVEHSAKSRLLSPAEPKELPSLLLLELSASVMRLARTLYEKHAVRPVAPKTQIVLGLGLFQILGWSLLVPAAFGWGKSHEFGDDHILGTPVVVRFSDLSESPDYCAYLLVRQVFAAYGLDEQAIPAEYNRDARRLVFPR